MAQPKQVVPLTEQQQALAARWVPLARKVAAHHGVDLGVTLEAVCRAARGYDTSRGWTMQAWATRILTNACIDELRKKRHIELLPFDESLHSAAAGCTDIMGERDSLPEPVRPWTPPPDVPERKLRPPGTSARSVRRRAAAAGQARPIGRPAVLDPRALYRVLVARPGIANRALAEALGLHRNTLRRGTKNGQLLRRLRVLARVRIFGNGKTPDRAPPAGAGPSTPAAALRF